MRIVLCLLLFLAFPVPVFAQPAAPQAVGDYVVLMHGIGRSPAAMKKMEADLRRRGYGVLNLGYDSRKHSIAALVDNMHADVDAFAVDKTRKLHFVGHSMGALVIRAYAQKYKPANMGRIVALGSPNTGSEVADFLSQSSLYEKFYGPAGLELTTVYRAEHTFDKPFYEIGTIAGDRTIDPLSSVIIPGDDDGKVSIASTHVAGEKDHIVLHANHATMPSNAAVIIETAHFLQYGFFKRAGNMPR
ncbi:MAG: alpha/beta hydrolase family protein [Alphaproteobacteria bacterium]|nr:alpha/beta hydrolase family protein [Alphaproteobacteria bacterium]